MLDFPAVLIICDDARDPWVLRLYEDAWNRRTAVQTLLLDGPLKMAEYAPRPPPMPAPRKLAFQHGSSFRWMSSPTPPPPPKPAPTTLHQLALRGFPHA